jgi:lysophospholipase L1-like esterase
MFGTLRDRGIPYVDPLAALAESLAGGAQPYPEIADGHPNATGHRVIAEQVADALAKKGWLEAGAAR